MRRNGSITFSYRIYFALLRDKVRVFVKMSCNIQIQAYMLIYLIGLYDIYDFMAYTTFFRLKRTAPVNTSFLKNKMNKLHIIKLDR